MSTATAPEVTPNGTRARRREWLLRGAFEAVLILVGLLGAFALDEWQDARARATRVEALLAAVRAELEANLLELEDVAGYNTEVAESIWKQATAGVTFIPDGTYPRGLLVRPQLTSTAWSTAQNDVALSDAPVETVLSLAGTYDLQRTYTEDYRALVNSMYATLLQPNAGIMRVDGLADPLRIGGVLRDYARGGAQLVVTYRSTLEQLRAEAAAPDSAETPE